MSRQRSPSADTVAADVLDHGPALLHAEDGTLVARDEVAGPDTGDAGVARSTDPVLTGAELRQALTDVRHVFVHRPDQLVPVRLTPDEAKVFLRRASGLPQPVIVTARVRGLDMVVHTLHYLGHPTRRLRLGGASDSLVPGSGDATVDSGSSASSPADLLTGLGRPRRVSRVGRVTRQRPLHGLLIVPVRVSSRPGRVRSADPDAVVDDDESLPAGVTAVDDRDSY